MPTLRRTGPTSRSRHQTLVLDARSAADLRQEISHVDLLALARDLQAAAVADDERTLARAFARLRDDLYRHVELERDELDALPAPLRYVVAAGQERLFRLVDAIAARDDADHGCARMVHSAELVVALRRQAALESVARQRPVVSA